MSLRKKLGKIFLCVVLEMGALSGAVRPEEIEKIMQLSEPVVTQTLRRRNEEDDELME